MKCRNKISHDRKISSTHLALVATNCNWSSWWRRYFSAEVAARLPSRRKTCKNGSFIVDCSAELKQVYGILWAFMLAQSWAWRRKDNHLDTLKRHNFARPAQAGKKTFIFKGISPDQPRTKMHSSFLRKERNWSTLTIFSCYVGKNNAGS